MLITRLITLVRSFTEMDYRSSGDPGWARGITTGENSDGNVQLLFTRSFAAMLYFGLTTCPEYPKVVDKPLLFLWVLRE
jgi:hypothetical protein